MPRPDKLCIKTIQVFFRGRGRGWGWGWGLQRAKAFTYLMTTMHWVVLATAGKGSEGGSVSYCVLIGDGFLCHCDWLITLSV